MNINLDRYLCVYELFGTMIDLIEYNVIIIEILYRSRVFPCSYQEHFHWELEKLIFKNFVGSVAALGPLPDRYRSLIFSAVIAFYYYRSGCSYILYLQ